MNAEFIKDLKRQQKEARAEMKERGIKKTSCFNGGLDPDTYRFNARLFELSVQLERAYKEGAE